MRMKPSKAQNGFTLLELLVVIAVIGLLASIAVARYQPQLEKSNRQAAVATLQLAQQAMERAFLRNSTYENALTATQLQAISSSLPDSHRFEVSSATQDAYVLSAVPVQPDATCGTLTINQSGLKTVAVSGAQMSDCWGN